MPPAHHRPPVVMIHGAFCGGWAFEKFRAPFEAAGFPVITPTLRHHDRPRSVHPHPLLGTTGLRDYLGDLLHLVRSLGEPPVLIGHSMGGLLVQMLAAERPTRAAVLLAPSAPWGVLPSGHGEIATAAGLYLSGEFWRRPLRPVFRVAAEYALDRLPPDEQRAVYARFVPESGQAAFEIWHWPMDLHRASYVQAHDVRCPVLCLAGGRDEVNPAATARRVAQRYRERATFEVYPEMSHWLIGEPGWDVVARDALAWTEDVLAARRTAR